MRGLIRLKPVRTFSGTGRTCLEIRAGIDGGGIYTNAGRIRGIKNTLADRIRQTIQINTVKRRKQSGKNPVP